MHDVEDPLFGWVRAEVTSVAPPLPWNPPEEDITSVDGSYGALNACGYIVSVRACAPDVL